MRSSAVGIDKQKNGFVNLGNFPVYFERFQSVYRLKKPPPAMLGAASVLRGRRVGPSRAGPTQRTLLLRHCTGKWLKR
jgi:hypothetical protein